jgi:hypothetical protein
MINLPAKDLTPHGKVVVVQQVLKKISTIRITGIRSKTYLDWYTRLWVSLPYLSFGTSPTYRSLSVE